MKNPQTIVLFLIGAVLIVAGALFKIMHWQLASLLLIVGLTFQAVSILLLLFKLKKKNNTNSFMDS